MKTTFLIPGILLILLLLLFVWFAVPYSPLKADFNKAYKKALQKNSSVMGSFSAEFLADKPRLLRDYIAYCGLIDQPMMHHSVTTHNNADFLLQPGKPLVKIEYTQVNFANTYERVAFVDTKMAMIMNGGKDFCEWSKMDDLLYATMRLPVETVLGKDGIGLADCAICESKLEKGEDISTRLLALMARINEIQRKGTPDIFFATMGLMIRVQVMQGKAHTALSTLEEVRQNFVETGQARFLANVDAMRCRIWLRLGMQEEIDRWLRETAPSITSHFRAMWRYQYMTKAMVQIACGTPNEALLSIAPLLPYCERCARIMDSLHLRVLVAICHYRQKDDHWKPELLPALDAAADYGFITPVAQYGAAILPLLTTCGWNKDPAFYQRLLAATREQTVYYPDFLRPAIALAEPLTPAEKQVLRLLCHNRSNQEIADILGVKLPTIKSQVRSILQKLDVKRRSEAKEAAETLNLL